MNSIILILVATCIFLPFVIYKSRKKNRIKEHKNTIKLPQVEAGPTGKFFKHSVDLTSLVEVDIENIVIDPSLKYFVVKNQCMQIKGISDGDIVGVNMIEDKESLLSSIKQGSMLLISLNDGNFKGYKLREVGELTDDKTAFNTYHYKGGVQHKSSKPHSIDSIKGIVVEVHQREYLSSY